LHNSFGSRVTHEPARVWLVKNRVKLLAQLVTRFKRTELSRVTNESSRASYPCASGFPSARPRVLYGWGVDPSVRRPPSLLPRQQSTARLQGVTLTHSWGPWFGRGRQGEGVAAIMAPIWVRLRALARRTQAQGPGLAWPFASTIFCFGLSVQRMVHGGLGFGRWTYVRLFWF
jgi:hypothetical protein